MPVVKTAKIYFNQPDGSREFQMRVNCDGSGEFSIALPPGVEPVIGIEKVKARTLADAERAFDKALADFKAARSVVRKVIYYRIGISAAIMDAEGCRCILKREDIHFSKGAALCIYAGVFEETEITDASGKKRYNYSEVESSIPDFLMGLERRDRPACLGEKANNLLEWTPDREAFFAKIGAGLRGLILQLSTTFKDPAEVQKLADSGGTLLLG